MTATAPRLDPAETPIRPPQLLIPGRLENQLGSQRPADRQALGHRRKTLQNKCLGLPCIVGASDLKLDPREKKLTAPGGRVFSEGDIITVVIPEFVTSWSSQWLHNGSAFALKAKLLHSSHWGVSCTRARQCCALSAATLPWCTLHRGKSKRGL